MRISVNELETLARKAAIGAGIHHGYASEAAQSLVWLSAAGIDAIQGFIDALQTWSSGSSGRVTVASTGGTIALTPDQAKRACVLYAAPAAVDFLQIINETARQESIELVNIDCPILLLASVATRMATTSARQPLVNTTVIRCSQPDSSANRWTAWLSGEARHLAVHLGGNPTDPSPANARVETRNATEPTQHEALRTDTYALYRTGIDIDAGCYNTLKDLMNLTLVPDSEESRKHGAGAGLVDSD